MLLQVVCGLFLSEGFFLCVYVCVFVCVSVFVCPFLSVFVSAYTFWVKFCSRFSVFLRTCMSTITYQHDLGAIRVHFVVKFLFYVHVMSNNCNSVLFWCVCDSVCVSLCTCDFLMRFFRFLFPAGFAISVTLF